MKNIHLLPTEKPSRLWLSTRKENYLIFDKFPRGGVEYVEPKNIYITSEKDIKDNDWIITKDGRLVQVSYLLSKELDNASKIILTTDQDLIKDGVQAIDDEFLEWFVKNPSCDNVEVVDGIYFDDVEWISCYKIIIPKKEPKQETLEDAAKNFIENTMKFSFISNDTKTQANRMLKCVEFGAKWQQEQNKKLYSEEEVLRIITECKSYLSFGDEFNEIKWFEQFKKK
ncbi:MAG: hypothetical protein E6R13_00440 [Spirochaetes bacterium]|nr:MAG: hypothetical protein E6R13_00440 [Spirochaetota bacterium]